MGFARRLKITCSSPECNWEESFFTSDELAETEESRGPGRNYFEANVRAVVAFRELG